VPFCRCDDPEKYDVASGDIVVARTGATTGKSYLIGTVPEPAVFASYLIRVRTAPAASPSYVAAYMQSPAYWQQITTVSKGTAQPGANASILGELTLPLPPLAEQRRIAAKLEDLLTRGRRAKNTLDAIPPLLETLRRSILAAAFRGDLTAEWREKHPDVEPADRLLARIHAERRKKWEEAELARLRAKGKAPTDDRWKEKYREPEPIDASELPELPEAWAWASLESITDAERGIPYGIVLTGEEDPSGTPTVRCGDIKAFCIDIAGLKRVRGDIVAEYQRTRLEGGEVLLAIRGTVGATAVATPAMKGMNISREVAMIPPLGGQDSRMLMYCLASPEAQARLLKHVKGVAQSGINLSDLRTLPVPIVPVHEQAALNVAIDRALGGVARLVAQHARAVASLPQFDAAILAKAFRGELVLQDPDDEPAEVILARLKAAMASAKQAGTKRALRKPRP
jgi:type I restriction enzyme S subunit